MSSDEIVRALEPVVRVFDRLEVRYYLGGSVASSARGVARSTLDVDLVAELGEEHVGPLFRDLDGPFYLDERRVRSAVRRGGSFNAIHLDTMVKIDVFVSRRRPWDDEAQDRATEQALAEGTRPVRVASAEDVVVAKLAWYESGGRVSERQWSDVLGVLRAAGETFDGTYALRAARSIGVADLLEAALRESSDG